MRKFKFFLLKITALFFSLLFSNSLQAQEYPEIIQAIDLNLRLITQLDQFNLHVSNSYIDCLCFVILKSGNDPRCEGRNPNASYIQSKINHLGEEITETKVCTEVVDSLVKRVEKLSTSIRINLALIQSYEKSISNGYINIHLERPKNREKLQRQILPTELVHLESLIIEPIPLEPMSDLEAKAILDVHFKYAEQIRNMFLQSNNYQKIFNGFDSNVVLNFLKTGESQDLEKNLQQFKSKSPAWSETPWISIQGLTDLYRQFLIDQKRERITSLKKAYERDLNSLPILGYLKSPKPKLPDLLSSLFQVNANALKRTHDSKMALISFTSERQILDSEDLVSDYAFIMDHSLSQLYIPILLKVRFGWTEEKIKSVITALNLIRSEQKRNKRHLQLALLVGSTVACLVPYPGLRLIATGAKILIKNFCFLGLAGGVNTYYLLDSRSNYVEKIGQFLSTPDGWNQIVKMNQVLAEKNEFNSWLLFYIFEAVPAFQIAKHFLRF